MPMILDSTISIYTLYIDIQGGGCGGVCVYVGVDVCVYTHVYVHTHTEQFIFLSRTTRRKNCSSGAL